MWKRLTLSLVAVAALSALVMGASFALFTASTTNSANTFTAGTVTLSGSFASTVAITGMVPGDAGDKNYTITYTGNVPAWVGLDTNLTGTLTTCSSPNGLQVTVDNGVASTAPGYVSYNSSASNQLLNGTTPSAAGSVFPIHFHYSLPTAADNSCQAQSATFTIGVHAVQAGNNPLSPAGQPSWS